MIFPEGTTLQTDACPYVFAAFVGMIARMLVGRFVEFLLKLIFARGDGKLLLKSALAVFSRFNDSEELIGLSTRFGNNKKNSEIDI